MVGALAVVIAATWGLLALMGVDFLARIALERWGPRVAGVTVDVERVNVSVMRGSGFVQGLELGPPPGFRARTAHFGTLDVRLERSTLLSSVTVVHELAVDSLNITYERADRGSNLDAIQRSIEAYVKQSQGGDGGPGPGKARHERRYIVERLSIRNVRVLVTHPGMGGQGVRVNLPDVDLRDVGKGQGGLTAGQVAALVTAHVQQKIALRVLTNVEALRRGGLEGAIDALRGLLK